ncbi:MAG: hypothetical protein IT244_13810 [Bacteroidia bacterium]|nr:hypothetical protein [Bacteroidia bacterium]
MNNRWVHTIAGAIAGAALPLFLGGIIAMLQGIKFDSFVYSVFHRIPFYSTYFQLGVASNIGVFFLIMKKDSLIYFGRGWLVATILCAMWAVMIEINGL